MTHLDLFHCEKMRADLSANACLVNQARGELEGELSLYYKCLTCDVGAMLREANGGELPPMTRDGNGQVRVVRPRGEEMAKHAVKIKGEAVTLPGGVPLTGARQPAAAKIAAAITPPDHIADQGKKAPTRPCKNHRDRERAKGKSGLCLECLRAYQREWYSNKKKQQGNPVQSRSKKEVPVEVVKAQETPEPAPALAGSACGAHPDRPVHGNGNCCLECYQAKARNLLQNKEAMARARQASGTRAALAQSTLKRFQDGELIEAMQRFDAVFALVPGLEMKVAERAEKNLRPMEAEIAVILRNALEAE